MSLPQPTRRKMIFGAVSVTVGFSLSPRSAMALSLGDIFKGVGAALFPSMAVGLAGFAIIKTAGNANDLIDQTKQLEAHIDIVVSQLQDILKNVQTIVDDCTKAVEEIKQLVQQLPSAMAAAIDQEETKKALNALKTDVGIMQSHLRTHDSIRKNRDKIEDLCGKIAGEINTIISDTNQSHIEMMMRVIPALSAWVQGYTAYCMVDKPEERDVNPWDNALIKGTIPSIQAFIAEIDAQRSQLADVAAALPAANGLLYQFDGVRFIRTDQKFQLEYKPNTMTGNWYALWPAGVSTQSIEAQFGSQIGHYGEFVDQIPGDFCYLHESFTPSGPRIWSLVPSPTIYPQSLPGIAEVRRARAVYNWLVAANAPYAISFQTLTEGFGLFEQAVQDRLVKDEKVASAWVNAPAFFA